MHLIWHDRLSFVVTYRYFDIKSKHINYVVYRALKIKICGVS